MSEFEPVQKETNPDKVERLGEARGQFIEKHYPRIFGEEEMGDPSSVITPQELTTLLAMYELHLNQAGLLAKQEDL